MVVHFVIISANEKLIEKAFVYIKIKTMGCIHLIVIIYAIYFVEGKDLNSANEIGIDCFVKSTEKYKCFVEIENCNPPPDITIPPCLLGRIKKASEDIKRSKTCEVFTHKGKQCYYKPMGDFCSRPPGIYSKCVQGYGRVQLRDASNNCRVSKLDNGRYCYHKSFGDPCNKPKGVYALCNWRRFRKSYDPEAKCRVYEIYPGRKCFYKPSHDPCIKPKGVYAMCAYRPSRDVDRVERDEGSYYYDYVEACMVYRMHGRPCYWRPIGSNCYKPKGVYARCAERPMDDYDYFG